MVTRGKGKYIAIKAGLLVLASLLVLAGCASSKTPAAGADGKGAQDPAKKAVKTFRLAHTVAPDKNHPYTVTSEAFKKYVEEKTNGSIKVNIFPGGQLGSDADLLEMIRGNTLELGVISGPVLSTYSKAQVVLDLPWFYENNLELQHKIFTSDVGKSLLEQLSKDVNVKAMGLSYQGFRHFVTNKPVKTVEDLKGLKFRTQQSPLHIDIFKAIGTNPTPIPYTELYTSMESRVIDGFETDLNGYVTSKFYEIGKQVTLSGHFSNTELLLMSNKAFDGLSDEEKKIMTEASKFATEEAYNSTVKTSKEFEDLAKKNGATINTIDIAKLRQMVQPVYDSWSAKDPVIKEYIDKIEAVKKQK